MTPHDEPPPRYAPQHVFPPYTYVPGRTPHPLSDPAGHSHGRTASAVAPLDDANWSAHDAYLHAVDLFNHGYYWEAHEAWESAWHAVGRRGPIADFLKGLIKLAAAGVKAREGRPAGVVAHARRAAELFAQARPETADRRLGLSFAELAGTCDVLTSPPPLRDAEPTDVRPIKELRLVLLTE